MGLSITAAPEQLGVSHKKLSEAVDGRAVVTAEMVPRLELAFGMSASTVALILPGYCGCTQPFPLN